MKGETELLQAVLEARQEVADIDAKLSAAKEVKKKAEEALIEYMDNRDLKSFKSAALNRNVIRKDTLHASIEAEKRDEALRWITEDCGRGDIIKQSIHNKTLSSFVSRLLKDGEPVPQGLLKYYFKPELSISVTNKK